MPEWFVHGYYELAFAATKAALMYLVALLGLRLAHRRTLAQWTAIDFAAAVAIGAIVGRTAIAGDQSFAVGAVALVTILAAHWIATVGRFNSWIVNLVDHRVRVLVDHGRLRDDQLRLCGLTESEVLAQLRRHGVAQRQRAALRAIRDERRTHDRPRTGRREPRLRARTDWVAGCGELSATRFMSRLRRGVAPPGTPSRRPGAAEPARPVDQRLSRQMRWTGSNPPAVQSFVFRSTDDHRRVRRYFRDHGWAVRVPRQLKDLPGQRISWGAGLGEGRS